jgi:ankyrin repeat protein
MNSKDFRAVNIILDAAENDAITKSDPAFNRQLFFNEHSKPLLKIASGGNTPNWHSTPDELAVVQRLINNGTDINDTDEKGYTALIYAAKNGNTPLVTFLLNQKGIDTSLKTKDTNLSVYDVAADNSAIQKLLHAFAKKQLKDQSFIAPGPTDIIADYLHEWPGSRAAIQQSRGPRALINDDDREGLAAWISEQKKNNPRFDINAAIDEWTEPLLIVATRANRPEIAGFLLNTMGANTRAQGFDKMTALHIAARQGLPTIVDLIIKADYANPKTINAEAANYLTPLLVVAKEGLDGGMAAATLLVDAGANVNAQDFDGYTPLMYAALSKKYPLIELLLAHGARANDTRVSRTGPQSALDYIPDTAENAAVRTLLKKHMATQTTQKSKNAKKRKSSESEKSADFKKKMLHEN